MVILFFDVKHVSRFRAHQSPDSETQEESNSCIAPICTNVKYLIYADLSMKKCPYLAGWSFTSAVVVLIHTCVYLTIIVLYDRRQGDSAWAE